MIVENPYTQPHYLTSFFPIKPKLIDKDRTKNGDYYKKPTQYWFINCEPENNILVEPLQSVDVRRIDEQCSTARMSRGTKRSLMHPQYANRFIRQYVLDGVEGATE